MADQIPGQTREGLALLFFNAVVQQEFPEGKYSRAYALDLLAEVMAAIDGDRPARSPSVTEPSVEPMPELEAELAAEAPPAHGLLAHEDEPGADTPPMPPAKKRGRPALAGRPAAKPTKPAARPGKPRRG